MDRTSKACRYAALRVLVTLGLALGVSGCGFDRFTTFGESSASTENTVAIEGPRVTPPLDLVGRWMLMSPGTDPCALTFGAVAGATEGTITPVGGCPYTFFTARKWTYEDRGLMIRDHTGQLLVAMARTGSEQFEGQTAAGHTVTLTR